MAHNLTENDSFDATVQVPDDGDADSATTVGGGPSVPASLIGMQSLANRTKNLSLHKVSLATLNYQWIGEPPALQNNEADLTKITIGAVNGLILNGAAMNAQSAQTIAPTLAANTWYYVYAYGPGTITYEVVVQPPDPTATYKNTDATRRYVGCFRTDATPAIVPFRMERGNYVFRPSAYSTPDYFRALNAGSAIAWTAAPLNDSGGAARLLPPHCRRPRLRLLTNNTGASTNGADIRTHGDTGSIGFATNALASGFMYDYPEIECSTDQQLDYIAGAATVALSIWVLGFLEP